MTGKQKPKGVSPRRLRRIHGIEFEKKRKIRLRKPKTLNPIRAWRAFLANKTAEILKNRFGSPNKLGSEIGRFRKLAESIRNPDFALRERGERIINDYTKKLYREAAGQDLLSLVIGFTFYRVLLEGELLKRNPERLKEIKRQNVESRELEGGLANNAFSMECDELKNILTKKNELRHHELFSNPEAFDAVANRIYFDFREMSGVFGNMESVDKKYHDIMIARWEEHFAESKLLPRISELLAGLGRERVKSLIKKASR